MYSIRLSGKHLVARGCIGLLTPGGLGWGRKAGNCHPGCEKAGGGGEGG